MVISVENLSRTFKYYKKEKGLKHSLKNLFYRKQLVKKAVNNISFKVENGEFIGFIGPNGAGKTTTLKMLAGILYPTSGNIYVLGYTPWKRKNELKKQFSIILGQKNQVLWDLPACESLYLNKCIYQIPDDVYNSFLDELVHLLDVKNLLNVQVRRLSLGERMKFEIIAALLHKPKIIYLDEPTIGLDLISQKKIRKFLKFYNEKYKTTIILTSHYMTDIEELSKRIIIINKGEIIYDGKPEQINNIFQDKKIIKIELEKIVDKNTLEKYGKIIEYKDYFVSIEVDKNSLKNLAKRLFDELPLLDLNIQDIPLEQGIINLYQAK